MPSLQDAKKSQIGDLQIEEINAPGYERVIKFVNEKTKLKAIVAIHSTALGPALGGTRIYPYKNFDDALEDVLRLSKGMTYKSAACEAGFGGGESVIIADPCKDKTDELMLSFAEAVETLSGKYVCAEDVGCTVNDVMTIRKKTKYVVGLPHEKSSGDPGRFTAWGTFRGIQSVLKKVYGSKSMQGKKIAIQGLGNVGLYLVEHLFWAGADLVVSDINEEKLQMVASRYGIKAVHHSKILSEPCDVLAPCAMGAIINDDTIDKLNCKAIAGCANNQLKTPEHGDILHEKGILYAPDFVINSGGLINVSFEVDKTGYHPKKPREKVHSIYDQLMSIYAISEKNNISTGKAAIELAEYRIKYLIGKRIGKLHFHHSVK